MAKTGVERGFGIDENTALFVSGQRGRVIGEYGVFALDMRNATSIRGAAPSRISASPISTTATRSTSCACAAHRGPASGACARARSPTAHRRDRGATVFGAYTLYDVLARLVLGDPAFYLTDRASGSISRRRPPSPSSSSGCAASPGR